MLINIVRLQLQSRLVLSDSMQVVFFLLLQYFIFVLIGFPTSFGLSVGLINKFVVFK